MGWIDGYVSVLSQRGKIMKILVTGANGYLGQGVVKELLDLGIDVIATDIAVDHIDKRAKAFATDIFHVDDPFCTFGKPDCVLHLAWHNGFVHNSETHVDDLPLHYAFLKKVAESRIKRIAVMGSMHEVGFFEGCIDENTPCHPMNLYGISKNALRELTSLLCSSNQVQYQWLRGYYIVGNSKYGSSIFSKITAAVAEGKTEFPFTMGQNQYDFLDYGLFCRQVAAAVSQDAISGIINICSGKPEKLADRVERFIAEQNYPIALKYGVYPDRPYDSKAVWGNSSKIEKIMQKYEAGIAK